jgi:hypothetical protein
MVEQSSTIMEHILNFMEQTFMFGTISSCIGTNLGLCGTHREERGTYYFSIRNNSSVLWNKHF